MFPLWTVKNIRLSESNNTYIEVGPKTSFCIRSNVSTTLDMDIVSHKHAIPEWMKKHEERIAEELLPDGGIGTSIAFSFPDNIASFYVSNKKAIDQYYKEHWNRILRNQFDEVFSEPEE